MIWQKQQLELARCPHCSVASPHLALAWNVTTTDHSGSQQRYWVVYRCASCGGLILTAGHGSGMGTVVEMYPLAPHVDEAVPERAREYLNQALETLHAPAGAVMLTASAVDAMLKVKGYKNGSLNDRIRKAAADHLITDEMAAWAHDVRLDANEQRHADEQAPLSTQDDARRTVDFALALAEYLFVLPGRVKRGRGPQITVASPPS